MAPIQETIMTTIKRRSSGPLTILALFTALFLLYPAAAEAQWTTPDASQNINNTNTGNVGVGTTGPNRKLSVNNTAAQAEEVIGIYRPASADTTAGRSRVSFEFRGDAYSQNPQLYGWGMFPNTVMAKIGAVPQSFSEVGSGIAGTHASLGFFVNSAGHGGLLERMTIVGNGNVGIGTASPGSILQVQSAQPDLTLNHTNTANYSRLVFKDNGTERSAFQYIGSTFSVTSRRNTMEFFNNWGPLVFYTHSTGSGTERLRIDASGNVGVGTATPIYSLDVNGGVNSFRAKAATTSVNDAIATFENSSAIQMIVRGNGNVGIGTVNPSNKLHVAGSITVDGNINAKYQDLAEWVESSQQLPPGTVVVLDSSRSNQVVAATQAYDSRVAGVISLQPGITLGERGEGRVLVATTGRVKLKVDATNGPIQIGDLLVTSDREGYAMKSLPIDVGGIRIHRPGTLIGKALEPLANGAGEILVLLSLQ
jgi:hypothetical protein